MGKYSVDSKAGTHDATQHKEKLAMKTNNSKDTLRLISRFLCIPTCEASNVISDVGGRDLYRNAEHM